MGFAERLQARIAASVERTARDLRRAGAWRADADIPQLQVPPAYLAQLERIVAIEAGEGAAGEARIAAIMTVYGDTWPSLRLAQLASTAEPAQTLFHTPLDWERLPRLREALGRIGAPDHALQADTVAALFEMTCFGRYSPMLYTYPADLDSYAAELADDGVMATIDRRLTAPLTHEFSHYALTRAPLFPPLVDESLAGYLGVVALPEMAFPRAGDDNGLVGAFWFAQIGQALAAVIGREALAAAHRGEVPWSRVLPEGLQAALDACGEALYRRHRGIHLLDGNTAPQRWQKLFFLAAAGQLDRVGADLDALDAVSWADIDVGSVPEHEELNEEMAVWAIRAMTLKTTLDGHSYRVSRQLPPTPVILDTTTCTVSRPLALDETCEPAPPAYLFPPHACARHRNTGRHRIALTVDALDAVDDLALGLL